MTLSKQARLNKALTIFIFVGSCFFALPVFSQVPVVDAAGVSPSGVRAAETNTRNNQAGESNNNDVVMSLYLQLEQLQLEVQTLRGIIEEQSYEIRRMQSEQRDRYLDIDRRLSGNSASVPTGIGTQSNGDLTPIVVPDVVSGSVPGAAPENETSSGFPVDSYSSTRSSTAPSTMPSTTTVAGAGNNAGNAVTTTPIQPTRQTPNQTGVTNPVTGNSRIVSAPIGRGAGNNTGVEFGNSSLNNSGTNQNAGFANVGELPEATLPATPENEQLIYRSSLNQLLEEGDYEGAISGFQYYINSYPQGRYLTNAYYWQGEALILVQRLPQAEMAFRKVLDEFPEDAKAADALLKLGVVQNRNGNVDLARQTWESIRTRYPDSMAAIRAAEDYLSRL